MKPITPRIGGLAGAGAVLGRFIMDWLRRDSRHPDVLLGLDDEARRALEDERNWALWLATIVGAMFGILVGLAAMIVDAAQ